MIVRKKLFVKLVKFLVIFGTSLSLLAIYDIDKFSVFAATYNLQAYPLSGTEIKLQWESDLLLDFDIWQTTDGKDWTRVESEIKAADNSEEEKIFEPATDLQKWYKYTYTSMVSSGIYPFRNYYFAVSIKGSVSQYPEGVTSANATNEAVAFPPHQMGHGYFSRDTNLCVNCHSVHVGAGPKLLSFATVNDACVSCHDGTQSKYNVLEGTVDTDGTFNLPFSSLAGPFGSILNKLASSSPISTHSLDQPINSAPGGNTDNVLTEPLNCGSCHDPHFNQNYRKLKKVLPESTNVTVEGYVYTDFATGQERPYYSFGLSYFCMGCHKDYMAPPGSGSIPAIGTYQTDGKYRHPVGVSILQFYKGPLTTSLPLEGTFPDNTYVSCVSCHYSHGSTSLTKDQSNHLLRIDYRGVCEDCHKK